MKRSLNDEMIKGERGHFDMPTCVKYKLNRNEIVTEKK